MINAELGLRIQRDSSAAKVGYGYGLPEIPRAFCDVAVHLCNDHIPLWPANFSSNFC